MGGGPPRSNTKAVPGRKSDRSDGQGGVALDCPDAGRLATTEADPAAVGKKGLLSAIKDGVVLSVRGNRVAVSTTTEARRLAQCIGNEFDYEAELGGDGRGTFIQFRRV